MGLSKDELIKLIEEKGASSADFVIRTPDEEVKYLENFKASEVEKTIGQKISDLHKRYDDDIFETTGLKKQPTEHTYEFNKRLLSEWKGKLSDYERQISELKERASKTGDAKLHADLENVRKEFETFKQSKEKEVDELRKSHNIFKVKSSIEGSLSAFEFDSAIPEAARKVFVDKVVNDLTSSAEIREDLLVFLDENGNPLRNKNNSLQPYTAEELLSERLKDVIRQKRTLPGAKIPDPKKSPKSLPDTVNSVVRLDEWLMEQGYKRGTKEFEEIRKELRGDLPLGY